MLQFNKPVKQFGFYNQILESFWIYCIEENNDYYLDLILIQ